MNANNQKRGRAVLIGFAILALGVGAFAVGNRATAADDHGNTSAAATSVALNVPTNGTLDGFGDKDWFVLPSVPPGEIRVVASGQGFAPHVEVYDRFLRRIASLPGNGTQMQGPYQYTAPLGRINMSPAYMLVAPAGRVGSYTVVFAIGSYDGMGPGGIAQPPEPPAPPPPPPAPPSPTDDVPATTVHNFTASGFFEGRLEVPGDIDDLLYVVPAQGTYEFRITSEMPDAVADTQLPHTFQLNSWVAAPHVQEFTAGTEIRFAVHGLSELYGPYRIEVTPPPGMPMGPPAPPAPPPPGPIPPAPPPPSPILPQQPDLVLPIDPINAMAPKPAKDYVNWLNQNYRFTDPTVNGETIDAMALRDRWIQMDNGAAGLKVMKAEPTKAFEAALAPFGGKSLARTRFPNWVRNQVAKTLPGGGSQAEIQATMAQAVQNRRPLLLIGKREGTSQAEAWVAFGLKNVGGVQHVMVLDPSMPGQVVNLPLGPAGLLPVNSGGAVIKQFVFLGQGADVIYP
jgi:hypothetical protein